MRKGGAGGASTKTGLIFEQRVGLKKLFAALPGYSVEKSDGAGLLLYYGDDLVARMFEKHAFYEFLIEEGVDWQGILSKRLLPDDALLVIVRETLFVVEVKFQQIAGSVDEKLQTCDFKRKQYVKLTHSLNLKVEYVYVLNDWFKAPKYKDTLDYIHSVNCHYRFNEIPLSWLGLPVPPDEE